MSYLKIPGRDGIIIDTAARNYLFYMKSDHLKQQLEQLPGMGMAPYNGGHLGSIRIHDDTLAMLRNINFNTDGMEPFYFDYKPPLIEGVHRPKDHQLISAAFMSSHKRCFNLSTPRTGKTGSAILAYDYLQRSGKSRGAILVISTVTSLIDTWESAVKSTLPDLRCNIIHGGTGTKDRLKKLRRGGDWLIINYDGVKMIASELKEYVKKGIITTIVVDELTHYGETETDLWGAANHVINGKDPVPYCCGMTGSPASQVLAPFGMIKLINPVKVPCRFKTTWQSMVTYKEAWMTEHWQYKERDDAKDIIFNAMQPAVRFEKDIIYPDIPKPVPEEVRVELTMEQAKEYEDMRTNMMLMLKNGEIVNAANKAIMIQKIFQIALGTIIIKDDLVQQLTYGPRLEKMIELIKNATAKTVIFSQYIGVNTRTVKDLRKVGFTVERVDGRVTGKKRAEIFKRFREQAHPQVLVCHPKTTAFCVELAAADTMIFNGPPMSGGFIYEQAIERLASLKQTAEKINFIQLTATNEESKFFKGLTEGVRKSKLVSNLFTDMTMRRK